MCRVLLLATLNQPGLQGRMPHPCRVRATSQIRWLVAQIASTCVHSTDAGRHEARAARAPAVLG
jgi:hypothetical protein